MRVEREVMYFEPRCISPHGSISWYGYMYMDKQLAHYTEETVYIRDSGRYLYVYIMDDIPLRDLKGNDIECKMRLIAEIEKDQDHWSKRYGRKRK